MIKKTNKTPIKLILRKILERYLAKWPYFSENSIHHELSKSGNAILPATLNRYLVEFTDTGLVYKAGRGWYSGLASQFELDISSVQPLAEDIAKAFPLISFSCWSSAQVKGAMHHLLNRFVTCVQVERDSMESVADHLRDADWDVWLNPRGDETDRFTVRERTVIVRRKASTSLSKGMYAPIEQILVDLLIESRDLKFMSLSDYHEMLANLVGTKRISMATMICYARKRKQNDMDIFGKNNQLTPLF